MPQFSGSATSETNQRNRGWGCFGKCGEDSKSGMQKVETNPWWVTMETKKKEKKKANDVCDI